ncbi:MAG: hypothetical protein JXB39_07580 [Deltaproteobacteria bacterium]|nr:hypothetical protein [Deltaproteobacteria bacterium]
MSACTRCLIPGSFPGVVLGSDGLCQRCRAPRSPSLKGLDALEATLARRSGDRWDVVVPASGGLDSTWALWMARRQLGSRVLAVFYDNGFASEAARRNLEETCATLDVDLEVVRSRDGVERRFVREFLAAGAPLGISWGICTFCHFGIPAAVYRAARKARVPNVLWAITPFENEVFHPPGHWDDAGYLDIDFQIRRHWRMAAAFSAAPLARARPGRVVPALAHAARAARAALSHRLELYTPPVSNLVRVKPVQRDPGIRDVLLYQYVPWDGREIEATLGREIGFSRPRDRESPWKYDCSLFPITDWRFAKTWGISLTGLCCGTLVRHGLMDLDTARVRLAESMDEALFRYRMEPVLASLGLPAEVLESLVRG